MELSGQVLAYVNQEFLLNTTIKKTTTESPPRVYLESKKVNQNLIV